MWKVELLFVGYILISTLGGVDLVDPEGDEGPPHDSRTGDYAVDYVGGLGDNKGTEIGECYGKEKELGVAAIHPDKNLNITQTIEKYGYETELHSVHTDDGYILTLVRIPGGALSPKREGKIPVYLNHGIFGNAFSWVFQHGNASLAYKLSNAGYDVFLGNMRGNSLSDKHEWLDTESEEYWDFSWNELGKYDVPAVIDYILNLTGSQDTYYIGHSMGTTQYMVAMSDRPDYGNKIKVGFLLAPAGYISSTSNLALRFLINSIPGPYYEYWKAQYGKFMDEGKLMGQFVGDPSAFCSGVIAKCGMCDSLLYLLNGYNAGQVNTSITNYVAGKYFDRGATKIVSHFDQSITRGTFSYYDYGVPETNKEVYGDVYPPAYPLEKINAPTVVYYGANDNCIPPASQKTTVSRFNPSVIKENNRVQLDSFNHLDFLTAIDLEKYVTNRVLWIMDNEKYVLKNKTPNHNGKGSMVPLPKIKRKYFPPANLLPLRVPLV